MFVFGFPFPIIDYDPNIDGPFGTNQENQTTRGVYFFKYNAL